LSEKKKKQALPGFKEKTVTDCSNVINMPYIGYIILAKKILGTTPLQAKETIWMLSYKFSTFEKRPKKI
jgi:hypothetical protein